MKCGKSGKFIKQGEGTASISLDRLEYKGTLDGLEVHFIMRNDLHAIAPHERVTSFDFMYNECLYAVEPLNSTAVFKFIILKEVIFKKLKE